MGVNIRAKGFPIEMEMGYGTFTRFRSAIANHIGAYEGNPYLASFPDGSENMQGFIDNLNDLIRKKKISHHTAFFLVASDAEGRLKPDTCAAILQDISDMPEQDDWYGYVWSRYGRISDFRQILRHCIRERRCLIWS
jgi:hypothetical protein